MSVTDTERYQRERKFHGVELLRFLCAFAVILWHYQHFFMTTNGAFMDVFSRQAQPLYSVFFPAYNWGSQAVEIFWALSGFIFFWKYADLIHDKKINPGTFFAFRFSRLYPLHFVTLIAVAVLQGAYIGSHGEPFVYANNDIRHFALNLFLASHWGFQEGFSFNGPVWSISIEVLAYAVFFIAARRVRFTGRALAALIVALLIVKASLPWGREIASCLTYFFIGGAVHFLSARKGAKPAKAAILAGALAVALHYANGAVGGKIGSFPIIAISVALLFAFLALGNAVRNERERRAFAVLGSLTYSSYLLHFPMQLGAALLTDHLALGREIYFRPEMMAVFVTSTFLAAYASFHLLERPAQQWIRARLCQGFRAGQPLASPAPGGTSS